MKKTLFPILIFGFFLGASAQEAKKGEFHAWFENYASTGGAVVYPQYSWGLNTKAGSFGGYGFIEVAPHEPLFTNHLVVFTPGSQKVFSVHTETGGVPNSRLSFFQVGPRVNFNEAIPASKKVFSSLFVAALPKLQGIRGNNLLVAGATPKFNLGKGVQYSLEGYRRFAPRKEADYSEYWWMFFPKRTGNFSFGLLVIHSGNDAFPGIGVRYTFQ